MTLDISKALFIGVHVRRRISMVDVVLINIVDGCLAEVSTYKLLSLTKLNKAKANNLMKSDTMPFCVK